MKYFPAEKQSLSANNNRFPFRNSPRKTFFGFCPFLLIFFLFFNIKPGYTVSAEKTNNISNTRPVILLAAFGTSEIEARAVYSHIQSNMQKRYPDHEIIWGFTARFIVNKLRRQGINTDSVDEITASLRKRGVQQLAVQSLHIFPGAEFTDLYRIDYGNNMRVVFGDPLIASSEDVNAVVRILTREVKPGMINIGAAHGNNHDAMFNRRIADFSAAWQRFSPDAVLASIEGQPGTAPLEKIRSSLAQAAVSNPQQSVHFIPLMLVAGDHIKNDVLGQENSWLTYISPPLPAQPLRISVSQPLGLNHYILDRYFLHLDRALEELAAGRGTLEERTVLLNELEKTQEARGIGASSPWGKFKRDLPFWQKKAVSLAELFIILALGVIIGQIIEATGLIRYIAVLFRPLLGLGNLPSCSASAFVAAFQSGAAANSMLAANMNSGLLTRAELYTSVLVVSTLSLFAHLPAFVFPLGALLGWQATAAFFSVRIAAIIVQILLVLTAGRWIINRIAGNKKNQPGSEYYAHTNHSAEKVPVSPGTAKAIENALRQAAKTLRRIIVFVIPTYTVLSFLEYFFFFEWLGEQLPWLFNPRFLPSEAALIIPAQASNLYNGAIAAANFVTAGAITARQAVIILLAGSVLTAPIRTFRHALPTYIAILGLRPGTVLAVAAQIIRSVMVLGMTILLALIWK
ncbi:MAG: hypothetical protein A2096_00880 [Spirochaetes bacterium GWF1_41_5]|nr:MAG: hypothetical protein A2096_00880 [Spirochaetes bacterium GWF1_41_5]